MNKNFFGAIQLYIHKKVTISKAAQIAEMSRLGIVAYFQN